MVAKMTNYCSVRIEKKKASSLKGMANHTQRLFREEGSHIDYSKSHLNETLHGDDSPLWKQVEDQLSKSGVTLKKGSHNASVVAVEIVISATPTYFRDSYKDWGVYDSKKVDIWKEKVLQTLKDKYQDNFVHASLHLDEATPHIHAVVVPIAEKECAKRRTKAQIQAGEAPETYTKNVLDAKSMFNKAGLRQLQTDFAAPLKEIGIERGIANSGKKHLSSKDYWKKIEAFFTPSKEKKTIPKIQLQPKKLFESHSEYAEREENRLKKIFKNAISKLYNKLDNAQAEAKFWKSEYEQERERSEIIMKMLEKETIEEHLLEVAGKDRAIERLETDVRTLETEFEHKDEIIHKSSQKLSKLENEVNTLIIRNRQLEIDLSRSRDEGLEY